MGLFHVEEQHSGSSCSCSCSLFCPKPSVVRPSIHRAHATSGASLPPSLPPLPHAKLPQHSHIFPWRQRGGRPTQAGRYHCNVIPPLGLIVRPPPERHFHKSPIFPLSVYPSSPPSTYLHVWQSDQPDAIHDISIDWEYATSVGEGRVFVRAVFIRQTDSLSGTGRAKP